MKHKTPEELSTLTDQELLAEAKKMKSNSITNALLIGVAIGIIIYSIVKNSWGILTLIPVFFVYKLVSNTKNDDGLKSELKERGLK